MPASSPCVRQCVIDDASGLCRGCGRSLAEIAAWSTLSEPQRLAIMAALRHTLQRSLRITDQASESSSSGRPSAC